MIEPAMHETIPEGSLVAWLDPLGSNNREWILSYFERGDSWSTHRRLMRPGYVHLASTDVGPYIARHAPVALTEDMIVMREGPKDIPGPWETKPVTVLSHPSVVPRIADVLIHAGIPGATSRGAVRTLAREGVLFVQWTKANNWEQIRDVDRDVRTNEFLIRRGISDWASVAHVKIQQ